MTRRTFVGLVATAASAAPAPGMYTWLACQTLGVKANQRDAIDLAHRHGFQSVEPLGEELASMSADDLKRLAADLAAKNLRWGVANMRLNFHLAEPDFQDGLRQLPRLAKALQAAGVTRIYKYIQPGSDSLSYMPNFKLHTRRIADIATVLEDHRLRLGLEYAGAKTAWAAQRFPFIHSMRETRELIAATGKKNIGIDLDTFHWFTAHETSTDLLALTRDDIVLVDACDAPPGIPIDERLKENRALPCATGVIDLAAVMKALVKIGYDGPVRADPLAFNSKLPRDEAAAGAKESLRKLFALAQA